MVSLATVLCVVVVNVVKNVVNVVNVLLQHLQHLQHFNNRVQQITAGARMRKSYARHIMATNLLTTTNKFPSAAMARVAYLLANWVRWGPT